MDYEIDKLITEFKNLVDQSCVSMKKNLDEKNAKKVFDICKDYLEKKKTSLLKSFDDDSNDKLIDGGQIFNDEEIDDGTSDETYDIVDQEVVRSSDDNHDIMNMSFYKVNVNDVNSSASIIIESDHDIDADDMHGEKYLINIDEQSSVTCRRSFSMHDDSFTLEIKDNEIDSRHVTFRETMLIYSYENEEEAKEKEEEEENNEEEIEKNDEIEVEKNDEDEEEENDEEEVKENDEIEVGENDEIEVEENNEEEVEENDEEEVKENDEIEVGENDEIEEEDNDEIEVEENDEEEVEKNDEIEEEDNDEIEEEENDEEEVEENDEIEGEEEEKRENDNSKEKKNKTKNDKNDNINKSQIITRSHDKENENVLLINNKINKKSTSSKKNDNKIVKNIKKKENKKSKKPEKTIVTRSASRERYDLRPRV